MKHSIKLTVNKFVLTCLSLFIVMVTFGQETGGTSGSGSGSGSGTGTASTSTSSTTTSTTETTWYTQPWAWIVGGVLLLLIILLASRSGSSRTGSSDSVTVKKTVSRDSDVV